MSLGISMSNNLSIERGSEKFSFIYTLTVYCHGNSDRTRNYQIRQDSRNTKPKTISQDSLPEVEQARSPIDENSQNQQTSSALAKTNTSKPHNSSLAISQPTTIINDWYELETEDNYELDLFSLDAASEPNLEHNSTQKKPHLDKLLLLASIGYLIFVVWWLFTYTTGQNILPFFASNKDTIPKADVEFLNYMQRSLDIIDRQVIAQEKAAPAGKENPTVVYVPVYNQAAANPIQRYTPPLPTPIPLPPPPSEFTAIKPEKITLPPPPNPSAQLEIVETPKPKENKVATAISTPKINSTLVGLIELGEASAALFKIDGITQRIWLGETIHNTDWILKSVTQEKATITNQGQTRNLSIGESF